ncbi:MAG TPA: hypothetical protein EYP22_09055 [Methanosarcinales archaeon]|nr:hypothetical protein [Methanosarcinales archaeon]
MIRLGKIGFANCDFPYYGIEHNIIPIEKVTIIESHPVHLAKKISNKELDISPISSIMYPKLSNLRILPDISITSNDFTKSVLVCANKLGSLEDLSGKTLCIPETTATSATLIRILLLKKGIHCKYMACKGLEVSDMLKIGDAALLIGDSALHAIMKLNKTKLKVIADLGNEWKNMTGKKMVYALWVVREEYAKKYPENVEYILKKLLLSKNYGMEHISEIADLIGKKKNIDSGFMREYLHTLNYDFDMESIDSLKQFFKYAKECGLLEKEVNLKFFERGL